jgi:hypothetical protein
LPGRTEENHKGLQAVELQIGQGSECKRSGLRIQIHFIKYVYDFGYIILEIIWRRFVLNVIRTYKNFNELVAFLVSVFIPTVFHIHMKAPTIHVF